MEAILDKKIQLIQADGYKIIEIPSKNTQYIKSILVIMSTLLLMYIVKKHLGYLGFY
jgi:hypothetical protein